ncbi:MAG TPA: serine hydrolase domain-containing protein, partial [Polyangiaceae bacterium]|nr:serine hydrolase domain-containing protein [Polyangiaceae bacterium]
MLDSGLPDRAQDLGAVAHLVVVEHGAAPAAVVAASLDGARGIGAAGRMTRDRDAAPVRAATPFDLASVTKPMVALTMARLARSGTLALDEPLGDLVPWLADTASGPTPLELFASHRAGLEAHIRLFEPLVTGGTVEPREAARIAADSRRAECVGAAPTDGFAPVYSDMGYLLVGLALEARAG